MTQTLAMLKSTTGVDLQSLLQRYANGAEAAAVESQPAS